MSVRAAIGLLALAIGIGFLTAPGADAPLPVSHPPSAPLDPARPAPAAIDPEPSPPAIEELLAAARARESIPEAVPVDARIWGEVVDAAGRGVAGVEVAAWPVLAPLDPERTPPEPAALLCRIWREAAWGERHRVMARTDGRGRFDLGDLIGATYRVEAWAGASDDRRAIATTEPGRWVELSLLPPTARVVALEFSGVERGDSHRIVRVRPRDPALARALAAAGFRPAPGRREAWETVLQSGSRAPLAPGDEVTIGRREDWSATVAWDGASDPLVIPVPVADGILVRVRIYPGCEEIIAATALLEIGTGPPLPSDRFSLAAEWRRAHGRQTVPLYTGPGIYQVGVRLGREEWLSIDKWGPQPGGPVDAWGVVEVTRGRTELELEVPPPELRGGIVVEVLGPDGERRDGQYLSLDVKARGGDFRNSEPRRIPDGRYYLGGLSPDFETLLREGDVGSVRIRTRDPELGWAEAPVPPGLAPEVTIRFASPAVLRVDLGDALAAEPLRELAFEVRLPGDPTSRRLVAEFDGTVAVLPGIQPGRATLRVDHRGLSLAQTEIDVAAGGLHEIPLPLEPLHPVEFRLSGGIGIDARIRLADGRECRLDLRLLDRERRLWLPRGAHRVEREKGDGPSIGFIVPASAPIAVEGE